MDVEKYVMMGIVIVLIAGFVVYNELATNGSLKNFSFSGFSIKDFFITYKKIAVFEGNTALNTDAFKIASDKVKIIVKINGIPETSSVIRLENVMEEYDVPFDYTLYIDNDKFGIGDGEVVIKDLKPSWYYVSIMTGDGNSWIIEVYAPGRI